MSAKALSSRAIRGWIFQSLISGTVPQWVAEITGGMDPIRSDQFTETVKHLVDVPAMREWIGGRQAKRLVDKGIEIINKKFESSIDIDVDAMTYDKTGQHQIKINDLTRRYYSHWGKMITDLLVANPVGYDGVALYADAHVNDAGSSQDNNLGFNAVDPVAPTADEMRAVILEAITALSNFKDEENEPLNEEMTGIRVLVPAKYRGAALAAIKGDMIAGGGAFKSNELALQDDITIKLSVSARLTADIVYTFRTDSPVPTVLRTQMPSGEGGGLAPKYTAKAEGSDYEHDTGQHQHGISCWRGVASGWWANTTRTTLT